MKLSVDKCAVVRYLLRILDRKGPSMAQLTKRVTISLTPEVWAKWDSLRERHNIPARVLSQTVNGVVGELCDTFEALERESTIGEVGYGTVFKILGESLGRVLDK